MAPLAGTLLLATGELATVRAMTEEHVHEGHLKVTRRDADGMREFTVDGPCLTCGEPINVPVTSERNMSKVTPKLDPSVTVVITARCRLPDGEPPLR